MKQLCILLILFSEFYLFADIKNPGIKSWETFKSDFGYEFKYPDCWELRIDDPDEEGAIQTIKHIFVAEGSTCARARFSTSVPNGISVVGGVGPLKSKSDAAKEVESREPRMKRSIERKEYLIYKRYKVGADDAVAWVESMPEKHEDIRWHLKLYCSKWWIEITGPDIDNADISYLEKFKKGDLALPEPEKTILESVRCIPAKH